MTFNVFGIEIHIKKEMAAVIGIFLIAAIGLTGYLIVQSDKKIVIDTRAGKKSAAQTSSTTIHQETTRQESDEEKKDVKKENEEEIKVYVVGCVKNPGIVTLKKGQLIADAINAAGGAANEADMNSINLVYKLKENVMLYIKSKKEVQADSKTGEAGKGIKIVKDSGGAVVNNSSSESSSGGKVNINTASASELDTLPGIGEVTANDIIDYREKNGPFKTIKDIMNVPRIKESRFNSIKDFITVD